MRGKLASEVSFELRMGVLGALLLRFLRMKVGPRVYVVEVVEGRCQSSGIMAAAGDGYGGCRESASVQRGYGESWMEEHS